MGYTCHFSTTSTAHHLVPVSILSHLDTAMASSLVFLLLPLLLRGSSPYISQKNSSQR